MTEAGQKPKSNHQMTAENREKLTFTGVAEVLGYDTTAVLMKSSCGDLLVKGSGLVIKTFDQQTGRLVIEGRLDALQYAAAQGEKVGLLGRLFG